MNQKNNKKAPLIIVSIILIVLVAAGVFAYKGGYLDNILDNFTSTNKQKVELPEDYVEPKLTLKSEYSQGIIYENTESFDIKEYVDFSAYGNKSSVWFELVDEDKANYKTAGEHNVIVYLKDNYGKQIELQAKLFTIQGQTRHEKIKANLESGLYDGTWLSEAIEDSYFQFEITYPEVSDSNGNIGEIVVSDVDAYDFSIIFYEGDTPVEIRFSNSDNGSQANMLLPNDDGTFTTSINIAKQIVEETDEVDVQDSDTNEESNTKAKENNTANTETKKSGHYEMICVQEAYDEVIPAYDEEIVIQEGWVEQKLIKEAYDEEYTHCVCWGPIVECWAKCGNCGLVGESYIWLCDNHFSDPNADIECHWSYDYYVTVSDEDVCKEWETDVKHHDAEYETIIHEPETEIVHHEAQTIHHEAVYEKVWVED